MPFIDMTYDPEWAIWLRAVGMGDFKPKRVFGSFYSTMIAVEAAMEGAGVAVGPPQLFREELAFGKNRPSPQIVDSGKAWWSACPPASASWLKTKGVRGNQ